MYNKYNQRSPISIIDTKERMKEDGIHVPNVFVNLRRYGIQQDGIKKIVLGNNGRNYSIAILVEKLSLKRIKVMHADLENIMEKFNGKMVLLYPLGFKSSESLLFNTVGYYVVYP